MPQFVLQLHLLWRRKPPELRVVFEGAALLRGREILISAKPVSGVPGLVLRRTRLSGRAGIRAIFSLKPVPLPVRPLGLLTRWGRRLRWPRLYLGERRGQQQKRCQTARNLRPPQHALVSSYYESHGFAVTSSCTCSSSSTSKSAYNSSFLSNACRSPTAVPGCTGRPRDGGLVAMVSV